MDKGLLNIKGSDVSNGSVDMIFSVVMEWAQNTYCMLCPEHLLYAMPRAPTVCCAQKTVQPSNRMAGTEDP